MQVLGQPRHSKAVQMGVGQTSLMCATVRPKSVFTPSLMQTQATGMVREALMEQRCCKGAESRGQNLLSQLPLQHVPSIQSQTIKTKKTSYENSFKPIGFPGNLGVS